MRNIFIGANKTTKIPYYIQARLSYKSRLSRILCSTAQEIDALYREISESGFLKDLILRSNCKLDFCRLNMLSPLRGQAIYVICRISKPDIVVETGVADGFSSSFILQALEVNKRGILYSIDLPNQPGQKIAKETGWLIRDELRHRWNLILGASKERLPLLLDDLKGIDLFYHDSDHSYENMIFEFASTWRYLKPGGILISDDITENNSFDEFTASRKCKSEKIFKLGIALNEVQ